MASSSLLKTPKTDHLPESSPASVGLMVGGMLGGKHVRIDDMKFHEDEATPRVTSLSKAVTLSC